MSSKYMPFGDLQLGSVFLDLNGNKHMRVGNKISMSDRIRPLVLSGGSNPFDNQPINAIALEQYQVKGHQVLVGQVAYFDASECISFISESN